MAKKETITTKATHIGFCGSNGETPMYNVDLSTEAKGHYAQAAIFADPQNPTCEIVSIRNLDGSRSRKGTAAEREAVTAAVIAAELERKATAIRERIAAKEEADKADWKHQSEIDAELQATAIAAEAAAAKNRSKKIVTVANQSARTAAEKAAKEAGLNLIGVTRTGTVLVSGDTALTIKLDEHDARAFETEAAAREFTFEALGLKSHTEAVEAIKAAEQPTPAPEPYTVSFILTTAAGPEARKCEVYATSAEAAILEAKKQHEQEIPLRTEWWHDGETLAVFNDADEIAWRLSDYNAKPSRPAFLRGLDYAKVQSTGTSHEGTPEYIVGLYDAAGTLLGRGYATLENADNIERELTVDDYMWDTDENGEQVPDAGALALIASAVAAYHRTGGEHPDMGAYVAAKEAQGYHEDEPWWPDTDEERAAVDGLSLEKWREKVALTKYAEESGPSADLLAATDRTPSMRAGAYYQYELEAWGYNGDGTPHKRTARRATQGIAEQYGAGGVEWVRAALAAAYELGRTEARNE